jgi:hypothetical protein
MTSFLVIAASEGSGSDEKTPKQKQDGILALKLVN